MHRRQYIIAVVNYVGFIASSLKSYYCSFNLLDNPVGC